MDKATLLQTLQNEWKQFTANFMLIDFNRLEEPGVIGEWSVKDALIHIEMWNHWTAVSLEAIAENRQPVSDELFNLPVPPEADELDGDAFNRWYVHQCRTLPLGQVMAQADDTFERILEAVSRLEEADLTDPERRFSQFPWKDNQPLWEVIASLTWEHMRGHMNQIQRWNGAGMYPAWEEVEED